MGDGKANKKKLSIQNVTGAWCCLLCLRHAHHNADNIHMQWQWSEKESIFLPRKLSFRWIFFSISCARIFRCAIFIEADPYEIEKMKLREKYERCK